MSRRRRGSPMSMTADDPIAVELIAVGRTVPRRDYGVLRRLGRRVLARMGWRAEGHFPDSPRLVVVIAPHSSIRDFVIGAAVLYVLGLRVAFIAKHTLFRWPLGGFMRWLGGIAVNRAQPENIVGTMTAAFSSEEKLWLGSRLKAHAARVRVSSQVFTGSTVPPACRYC